MLVLLNSRGDLVFEMQDLDWNTGEHMIEMTSRREERGHTNSIGEEGSDDEKHRTTNLGLAQTRSTERRSNLKAGI